jgi:hypothetical protein
VPAGRTGGALSFAGDDTVTVPDAPGLDLTTGMTLEAWLRPSSSAGWRTALAKESPDGLSYALYGSVLASDEDDSVPGPPGGFADIGGETSARGGRALPVGTWSHVAVTYDGQQLRFFLDGREVGSVPKPGSITTTAGVLRLGANLAYGGEYYQGLMDDVRLYDRALSGVEILLDQDRAAPTVAVSSPAAGAKLTGRVTVGAEASDVGGIAGVQFLLDGKPLGPEDTTAPYAVGWDTSLLPNGSHTLVAVSRDPFGNVARSMPVVVDVAYGAPGKVRGLRVSGKAGSARRVVRWQPPATTGEAPISAYVVIVRKGSKVLLTRQVTGNRLKLTRRSLRPGRLTVVVRAMNRIGAGAAPRVAFRVR